MKVKVTKPFVDKYDHSRLYKAGEVVDFDNERAMTIIGLALGELLEAIPAPAVAVKQEASLFEQPAVAEETPQPQVVEAEPEPAPVVEEKPKTRNKKK